MAQAKQSYYNNKTSHHGNKSEKKKHFNDSLSERHFVASNAGRIQDQPKKVYHRPSNDITFTNMITNDDRTLKNQYQFAVNTPSSAQPSKSNCEGSTDEYYYPRNFKNRKYSRDSANDSTSNDEAAYSSPIYSQKSKSKQQSNPKDTEDNFKIKYKTELCKYFEINGKCKFGDNCAYAHGKENLRSKVTNSTAYRTRKCKQFFENGFCPYGNRCQFAHALKSNIINNPYEKNMSYTRTMKMLSKKENVGNIKALFAKPRLPFFDTITKDDSRSTLFDDIKNLTEEYKRINDCVLIS